MSHKTSEHFRGAISYWLDEALGPDEKSGLEDELSTSQEARLAFLKYVSIHIGLCNATSGVEHNEPLGGPFAACTEEGD